MHPETDDVALPYVMIEETPTKVPYRNIDNVAPAGSINSSVTEMIRYIQFHIEKGKFEEEQLLSEATAADMQMPHMAIQGTLQYDELGHGSYGMGSERHVVPRRKGRAAWRRHRRIRLSHVVDATAQDRCHGPHQSRRYQSRSDNRCTGSV